MRASLFLALSFVLACGGSDANQTAMTPNDHADHHHHHHDHGDHGGPLVHRFEKAEEWAKEFDDPARDAWQKPDEVVSAMRIEPGMLIADIGAGTGYFEPYLSRAVGPKGKVLALDIEPDMIRYMRERFAKDNLENIEPKQVGLADPALAPSSVDRVLIVDTWHHIAERPTYTKKIAEGLKPTGLLFIVDFTLEAAKGPPKEHRLAPEKVLEELKAGGLSGDILPESLPDQYIVVAKKP